VKELLGYVERNERVKIKQLLRRILLSVYNDEQNLPLSVDERTLHLGIDVAESLDPTQRGVQVVNILPGGAADRCGLLTGDRIVSVDKSPIDSVASFLRALRVLEAAWRISRDKEDCNVQIVLSRKGQLKTVAAVVSAKKPPT